MKVLTKDEILQAKDLRIESLEVPEWGGVVYVRNLTGTERDMIEELFVTDSKSLRGIRAKMLSLALCDETGKRLFNDKDVQALGEKSARALDRVFVVAQRVSGFTKRDIDELTENLSEGQSAGSISD